MKYPDDDTRAESTRALLHYPAKARENLDAIRALANDSDPIARYSKAMAPPSATLKQRLQIAFINFQRRFGRGKPNSAASLLPPSPISEASVKQNFK